MSGHSKWHSIKHKKGALDAKRGKIFTKHAKLISIAARNGGDPKMNPTLRTAIVNAKADGVPNSNIEKAIKHGSGEDKNGVSYEEIMYEGYGPDGTAMLIEVITDNKNRAITNVKTIITKNGGRMGDPGSVSFLFKRKGLIIAKCEDKNPEEAELMAIDAGAEDLTIQDGEFEIVTNDTHLMRVRDNLEKAGFVIEKAEIVYLPKNIVRIDTPEKAKKVLNLMDVLEDDDDVLNVHSNFDIPEEIMKAVS